MKTPLGGPCHTVSAAGANGSHFKQVGIQPSLLSFLSPNLKNYTVGKFSTVNDKSGLSDTEISNEILPFSCLSLFDLKRFVSLRINSLADMNPVNLYIF